VTGGDPAVAADHGVCAVPDGVSHDPNPMIGARGRGEAAESGGAAVTGRGDLVVRRIGRLLPMRGPVVADAALVARGGRVVWAGPERELPSDATGPELDAGGAAVLPGFVDCHTHLVWAGVRRAEFTARLAGERYTGGGIAATVAATRAASYDELRALTTRRLLAAQRRGTTTIEIKSGYGLTPEEECRLLDIAADAAGGSATRVTTTYLGAHVVPPDRDRAGYVAEVIATLAAAKAHGAQWCDVFCDEGAFTVGEARRILTAARAAGLGLRMHADQVARIGATELAAELGCASADHLDRVDETGAAALAAAGTVAVLVPTATLTMRTGEWGHYGVLRDAGATVALATDCNPGTSWCESIPYVVQLACLALGMSVDAAFRAVTLHAAQALGRSDVGHLAPGAYADLVVLEAEHEADAVAHLGADDVRSVVVGGEPQVPGSDQSSRASSASTST
jgi:imidazolonepropionase